MSCRDEYSQYIGAAALASTAVATIVAEGASAAGTPLSVSNAATAIAAVAAMIAVGTKYVECLENAGNSTEAQQLRDDLAARDREIHILREVVGTDL